MGERERDEWPRLTARERSLVPEAITVLEAVLAQHSWEYGPRSIPGEYSKEARELALRVLGTFASANSWRITYRGAIQWLARQR